MTEKNKHLSANLEPWLAEELQKYMNIHKCNQTEALHELFKERSRQIEPQIEVIKSTPQEAKLHSRKIEEQRELYALEEKRLATKDAYMQKSFERRMKVIAGTARPTPQGEKIVGDLNEGNLKFQGVLFPKTERKPEALPCDAYGFYGDWDWTPEQIAELENAIHKQAAELNKCILCSGLDVWEDWEMPKGWLGDGYNG